LWWPFWKWRQVEIVQCRESIRDIIIYPHIKFWWYRTMLNFCGIVVAILKMATGRNCSMSESIRNIIIYPHIKFWWYRTMLNFCGIVVAILKMATGRNCSMSGHHYLTVVKELRSKMIGQHPGYFKAVFLKQTRTIIVSIYKYTVYIMFWIMMLYDCYYY
jgi:hypothetical protein